MYLTSYCFSTRLHFFNPQVLLLKNHPTAHVISYYSDGLPSLVLHVGMEFKNPEEAWAFWLSYARQRGFEVRKRYTNKRPSDGKVTSCRFVCANEGHQLKDKRDRIIKCPRAETRTDCQVHMSLKMDRQNGKMEVNELILEHNHALHLPETLHLLVSQRKISDLQVFEIETEDDAGLGPKAAHELASRQVGGPLNLSFTQLLTGPIGEDLFATNLF